MRGKRVRGAIGIVLMAISIGSMYFWLTYGQEAFATKVVLTANIDIEKGTVVDVEKHFKEERIDTNLLISGGLTKTDLQGLIGMASKQLIPKNAQISDRYFIKEGLSVSENKEIFKIPQSWIYAIPSSIRRGDAINIYEIDSNIETNMNAIRTSSDQPILSVSVLYVKDATNREVVDADARKRYDGTSQISTIEIVCTKEDMKTLEEKVAEGMKFIIAYHQED